MKCPPATTTSTLKGDIEEGMDAFLGIEEAPSRMGFRCRCCGKVAVHSATHAASRDVRLQAYALPLLIGRRGLSIDEIMRRCRVCIVVRKTRRGACWVNITGCSLDAIAHTCDIIQAHVARCVAAQRQPWNPLLAPVRRARKSPEETLASRPAGRWRLHHNAIVPVDGNGVVIGRHRDAAAAAAVAAPGPVCVLPNEHRRRPSAALTWRAVAHRRSGGCAVAQEAPRGDCPRSRRRSTTL